ncbi:hypothetical protein FBR05_09765 [Deltaproteobacteria bacterium PRO3]|nr:hypothetical protein [Deltaproteobacteria bacterium PRO3]
MGKNSIIWIFRPLYRLVPLLSASILLISQPLGAVESRGLAPSQRPEVVADASRRSFEILKLNPAFIKKTACMFNMDQECRMEACSKFYGLLSLSFIMAAPNAWNSTVSDGIAFDKKIDVMCIPLPKEIWMDPYTGALNKLYWECAKDGNDQVSKLPKDSCINPDLSPQIIYLKDPSYCFKDFAPEDCKKYDPTKELATCVVTGSNLAGLAQACGENCCSK